MSEPITIVSGLPRSGTSLIMQMLVAGGLPPLIDDLRTADENNPRGYFEFDPVKRLRSDQSWLESAQGHAVKIIHLLLRELPTDGSFSYRVLLMHRSLDEVVASQRAMLTRAGKPSADTATLKRVFQSQLAETEGLLARTPCFTHLVVEHQRLMREPSVVAEEINRFLGGHLDAEKMAAAVDLKLYRERS